MGLRKLIHDINRKQQVQSYELKFKDNKEYQDQVHASILQNLSENIVEKYGILPQSL